MEKVIVQNLENVRKILTRTREDIKALNLKVNNLHMILTGNDTPPPSSSNNAFAASEMDAAEKLRSKHIEIGSRDLMEVLNISATTLKRWRREGLINFSYLSFNHVAYELSSVYEGINNGMLNCKGLDRIQAMKRIIDYSEDIIRFRELNY